ncbi:MAG TPA: LPS assembly lipoprotein LptE [Caulobacteraceae bacterium]|jgi:LPS-assembly lipoprotein
MSTAGPRSALLVLATRTLAFGGLSASLAGCGGFTPLYAAQGVSPKLAAIEVSQPDGRLGFYMREYLEDSLARDRNQPPVYRLNFANRELRVPRGITVSNVASRYEVDLSTTYTLTEIATGKQVTRGQVSINVTYDVQTQPYASLTAQQDGERRAAEVAADRLRVELASYFASPRPTPANAPALPLAATYSERLPGAVLQTPRQQAEGELQPQNGQADTFGQPRQLTTTPETAPQPFSPSEDPNGIKTLPEDGSGAQ